ncbi:NADH-quinone oxidoreductase subunit L [Acidipropionibacterium thoenii]|uniref:NADH-quinone oxidoreductase subunit L n=1 Tax=Acidipropionibacterium thoenii TaxID=1751 RepID=UPI0003F64A89|nr:NADH-quinone oxidoreductase subunit L [Acidipropionibacterium thoenii]
MIPLDTVPLETVLPVAASGLFSLAWLMIAIPLAGAGLLLVLGRRSDSWGHLLGALAPIASFVIGLVLFIELLGRDPSQRNVSVPVYDFIDLGSWHLGIDLQVDQLSILFVLLVTFVGSLIHIYSIGYMAHDPHRRRFFGYLNLFIASMLILVLADNYLMLFIGWEGVGLCSYLLIGFWYQRPAAAAAGNKAFIMNRIGDLGLTMAIFTMLAQFGTVNFTQVSQRAPGLSGSWAALLGFMLLLAACGKSAQFPLQDWLMDAMEGPTPVSALIHAATMVTAGVYLVVRSHAIYAQSYSATLAVAIIGTITLLMGAWIGSTKKDIKRVLAGSTMSQIGYMMLAAGLGPIGATFAIFHLITHGAFKANMFLGAGSVMHGTGDDTDMYHFGALAKVMPLTFWTFACGYLAIIGFPFTSGYFSKDHIIEAAFDTGPVFGVLALIGAGITAYYMTRLMVLTFLGQRRWRTGVHPHESPATMTVPLIVLAILSIGAGLVMTGWIGDWLAPATGSHPEHTGVLHISVIGVITLVVVAAGVVTGWLTNRHGVPSEEPATSNPVALIGRNDIYGRAIDDAVVVRPATALAHGISSFDSSAVDGGAMGTAGVMAGLGTALRKLQNGYVRSYGLHTAIGVVVVGVVVILGRMA